MILEKKINKKNYRQAKLPSPKERFGYHCTVPIGLVFSLVFLYLKKGWWYVKNTELLGTRCLGIILHKISYIRQ
ncbi:hypothetical protein ES707_22954 [subsurface metagenome]